MKNVILYLNQFFGGVGGEDKADQEPFIVEGAIGPGLAFNAALKDAQITHTIVCGDNFMGSNTDEAVRRIMEMLKDKPVHMLRRTFPGGHDWGVWRRCIHDFLPIIF